MSFSIRDATLADMEALAGVFRRASLSNEGDRAPLLENPQWLALADSGVRDGRMRAAVDEDGTVLGFATFVIVDGVAELEDLFVDPTQMRRRIGEALVLDISARVRSLGFDTLEVTANPHALPVLRAHGVRRRERRGHGVLPGATDATTVALTPAPAALGRETGERERVAVGVREPGDAIAARGGPDAFLVLRVHGPS